ncbi:MAG: hypothetical protein MPJ24_04935 [Pirellulaceae bacterium]|nr:hypothetical protein [Pirellulaceae bacterium]
MKWYNTEKSKGLAWVLALPKCPCELDWVPTYIDSCGDDELGEAFGGLLSVRPDEIVWGHYKNPCSSRWEDPKRASVFERKLHSLRVRFSMRSVSVGGHYNQCTYDENGILFTEGPAAGSADWDKAIGISKLKNPWNSPHYLNDVRQAVWANELGTGENIWVGNPMHIDLWGNIPSIEVGNSMKQGKMGEYMRKYYEVRPSWHKNCPKKS